MLISEARHLELSKRVLQQNLSFITTLNQQSASLSDQGINVLKLSGGDPAHVPDALHHLIQDIGIDNKLSIFNYSPIAGLDKLRHLLSSIIGGRYHNSYSLANILVCSGACSGLYLTFKTLLNTNDRVLIQDPCWEYLPRLIENCNGVPVKLNYFANDNNKDHWDALLIEIEKHMVTGIKALVINSPLNPSGKIIPVEIINKILKLCEQYHSWLITDDVTIDFNFKYDLNRKIVNSSNYISVNSFSKNLGITGLRFGYVAGSIEFINQLKKSQLYTFMYPNSLVQELMLRYLSLGENEYFGFINKVTTQYKNNSKIYAQLLQSIPELEISVPDGGLFLFPKTKGLVPLNFEKLLTEYHVAVAPGEAFSPKCTKHFRIFLGVKQEVIEEAVRRFKLYFRENLCR